MTYPVAELMKLRIALTADPTTIIFCFTSGLRPGQVSAAARMEPTAPSTLTAVAATVAAPPRVIPMPGALTSAHFATLAATIVRREPCAGASYGAAAVRTVPVRSETQRELC